MDIDKLHEARAKKFLKEQRRSPGFVKHVLENKVKTIKKGK